MTKQMTFLANDEDPIIGWLTWWTIRQGEFDLSKVQQLAKAHDVPQYLQDRLTSRDIESAFTASTQLGANGYEIGRAGKQKRRIVTRSAIEGESKTRALVMEVTDPWSDIESWVTAKTVCIIELKGTRFETTWSEWVMNDPYRVQIYDLVDNMERNMWDIEGAIDDGRLRTALLAYLSRRHKITVRGSGGVYFLPHSQTLIDKDVLEGELLSIMAWLQEATESLFSVVAIQRSNAHNREQLIDDAISTVQAELLDINERLKKWQATDNMNAGSKKQSAMTQLDRIEDLVEMTNAFKEALGERVGVVEEMTNLLKSKLIALRDSSIAQVKSDHDARLERRREKRKSGSSKARRSKKTL